MSSPLECLLLQADLKRTIYEDTPPLQRMTAKAVIASLGELKQGSSMKVDLERCSKLAESMSKEEARVITGGLSYQLALDPEHMEARDAACVALMGLAALKQDNEDPGPCKGFQALGVSFGTGSSEHQPDPALLNPHSALAVVAKLEGLNPALAELCREVADGAISPTDATLIGKMRNALHGSLEETPAVAPSSDPENSPLPPSRLRAYSLYLEALKVKPELEDRNDSEAYDYIKEHIVDSEDDLPPSFETFRRYLSEARKHFGTRKHTPRAGRTGRSVASEQEI